MYAYEELYSYENLFLAYERARKGKTQKGYVIEFENNLQENLLALQEKLCLTLHQQKSKILDSEKGIPFLGFRVFYYHKLLQKKNIRKFQRNFTKMEELYAHERIEREKVVEKFEGWLAFAINAETYKLRKRFAQQFNRTFPIENTTTISHVQKQEKFHAKLEEIQGEFTQQKTLYLLKKGYTIPEIAYKRSLKEGTIWEHVRKLILYGTISIYKMLEKSEIQEIQKAFFSLDDELNKIYERLNRIYSYNTIACVQAHLHYLKKEMRIWAFLLWYQKKHCYRKCFKSKLNLGQKLSHRSLMFASQQSCGALRF